MALSWRITWSTCCSTARCEARSGLCSLRSRCLYPLGLTATGLSLYDKPSFLAGFRHSTIPAEMPAPSTQPLSQLGNTATPLHKKNVHRITTYTATSWPSTCSLGLQNPPFAYPEEEDTASETEAPQWHQKFGSISDKTDKPAVVSNQDERVSVHLMVRSACSKPHHSPSSNSKSRDKATSSFCLKLDPYHVPCSASIASKLPRSLQTPTADAF